MRFSRIVRWNLNNLLVIVIVTFSFLKYIDYKMTRRQRIGSQPRRQYGQQELIAVIQAPGLDAQLPYLRGLQSIDASDGRWNRTRLVERRLETKDEFEFLPEFKNPCYLDIHEKEYLGANYRGFPRLDLSHAEQLSRQGLHKYANRRSTSADVMVDFEARTRHNLRCLPYYFIAGFSHSGGPVLQHALLQHAQVVETPRQDVNWLSHGRFAYYKRTSFIGYINEFSTVAYKFADAFKRSSDGSVVNLIMGDASFKTIEQWQGHTLGLRYQNQTLNDDDDKLRQNSDAFAYSTPVLIKSMLPSSKIIIILRDPVDRIKSIYKSQRGNHSAADFYAGVRNGIAWWEACIAAHSNKLDTCMYAPAEDVSYDAVPCSWHALSIDAVRTSVYYLYIREWLITFRRHQLFFIDYATFKSQPTSTLNKVLRFLNLRTSAKLIVKPGDFGLKHSIGNSGSGWTKGETKLRSFYAKYNHRILPLIDKDDSMWSDWLQ